MIRRLTLTAFLACGIILAGAPATLCEPLALVDYRKELGSLRREFGGERELPDVRFFLFGMGLRDKILYRRGKLMDAQTGRILREWSLKSDVLVPPDYLVSLTTADGAQVYIREDEKAVWIEEAGKRIAVEGTERPLKLPTFDGHRYSRILRVLHHEVMIGIAAAGPLPNIFVYSKPWYRDSAMMALVLRETGNIDQIRDWILNLRNVFDLNNGGATEADNPGQVLFLVSLVADRTHPIVPKVLSAVRSLESSGPSGMFIKGLTDGEEHPAYQTKWLKWGLRSLDLPDPYVVPAANDSYSALFWMDYHNTYVTGGDADDRDNYPYLGWASDHFHGMKRSPIGNRDYPLTWEQNASEANYAGQGLVDPAYASLRLSTPHTWHAAEVFMYLLKLPTP